MPLERQVKGVFFRGAMPDYLTTPDIRAIVEALRWKGEVEYLGLETFPTRLTQMYLCGLRDIGFTHLSLDVESFAAVDPECQIADSFLARAERFKALVKCAASLGFWVNANLLVGLPDQSPEELLEAGRKLADMPLSQITLHPFLDLSPDGAEELVSPEEQFGFVERASTFLSAHGYRRAGLWTFAREGAENYSFLWESLLGEHLGLGPASVSVWGQWWMVKPELDVYLSMIEARQSVGFVAQRSLDFKRWQGFVQGLYRLRADAWAEAPTFIRLLSFFWELAGYVMGGDLTTKGMLFAHTLSEGMVSTIPSPLSDPTCVENYPQYREYRAVGTTSAVACQPSTSMLST